MVMSTPLRVAPVRIGAEHRAFWTLPYRLHRDLPRWPAPLRRDERRRWHQHAYHWAVGTTLHPAVERAARRVAAGGIAVRPFRPDDWDRVTRLVHSLYNASFEGTWGFVPIAWDDFRCRAEGFRPWYRPNLVLIAELEGRAVGFTLALPELSPLLARIRGRLWPFGAPYLALRARSVRRARLLLLGVLPEFTARGVAAALAAELARSAARLGLSGGELSLVHESNRAERHVIEACGGAPCKTFRVYQKELH